MAGTLEVELAGYADKIRGALGASVQNAIVAGLELDKAKAKVPHGEWGTWLKAEFGLSPRSARRFIRSSRKISKFVSDREVGTLLGSKSALYMLSEKGVADGAREQAIEVMRSGTYLTMHIAEGIIKAVEDAGKTAKYLDLVSDRVAAISTFHRVDPDIIPALTRIEKQMPDTFDEIEAAGCVYDAEGDPVPLAEANKRDVADYIEHNRFETKMRKRAETPFPVSDKEKRLNKLVECATDYVAFVRSDNYNVDRAAKYEGAAFDLLLEYVYGPKIFDELKGLQE